MDAFVAAFSLNNAPVKNLSPLMAAFGGSPVGLQGWTGERAAFVWQKAARYSDSLMKQGRQLLYVNGPLSLVPEVRLQARKLFNDDYPDRLSMLTVAARTANWHWLGGSFQAVSYDPATGQGAVLTDRLASRPLFYTLANGQLYISSHLVHLLNLPGVSHELDLAAVGQFIRYQTVLGDGTLYKAIKTLPAATHLQIDTQAGHYQAQTYWQIRPLPHFGSKAEAIEATAEAFQTATRRILADSSQPALLLSGGMDSRMLVASLDKTDLSRLQTYTYGYSQTNESTVSQQVAQTANLPWHFVEQGLAEYWSNILEAVPLTHGLHTLGHMHMHYPTGRLAQDGCDSVLNGWGMDAYYSGSYLPKQTFDVLGRELTTYQLVKLDNLEQTTRFVQGSLDTQRGNFAASALGSKMHTVWQEAAPSAVAATIKAASRWSDVPYDWIEYGLFSSQVSKFRSTPMMTAVRAHSRERNPLFEAEVIEVYQRLPYQMRFLGATFRQALNRLNPALMKIPYSNLGVSPLAPPLVQAVAMQTRAMGRANWTRLKTGLNRVGLTHLPAKSPTGNYVSSDEMASYIGSGQAFGQHILNLLQTGPLAQTGLIDTENLTALQARVRQGYASAGFTLMGWATLALWLDQQPFEIPTI